MVLVQKLPFVQLLFLRQNRLGKCLLLYSRTKKRLSRLSKKKFKKSKNCLFSKRVNPWFLYKNGHFSMFFSLSNTGQENLFYDILEEKNAFLGQKTKSS